VPTLPFLVKYLEAASIVLVAIKGFALCCDYVSSSNPVLETGFAVKMWLYPISRRQVMR